MKVFISWSGARSKETAQLLRTWLPKIVNDIEPWMSEEDLSKGGDWSGEITAQLDTAEFGIVCVTPTNMESPWLVFEAGALSRQVGNVTSKVAPLLIGFDSKSDLKRPLGRFQSTEATEEDMLKLVRALNAACALRVPDPQLVDTFAVLWPYFEGPFKEIASREPVSNPPPRPEREVIDEILQIVRVVQQKQQPPVVSGDKWVTVTSDPWGDETPQIASVEQIRDNREWVEKDIRTIFAKQNVQVHVFDWSQHSPGVILKKGSFSPTSLMLAVAECARKYPFAAMESN